MYKVWKNELIKILHFVPFHEIKDSKQKIDWFSYTLYVIRYIKICASVFRIYPEINLSSCINIYIKEKYPIVFLL